MTPCRFLSFSLSALLLSSLSAFAAETKAPTPQKAETLLIAPTSLKTAWQKYAKQRLTQGTQIKVVAIDAIDKSYTGPDIQEKIRLCIRKHIDQYGIESIILGGDSTPEGGLIPDRNTVHVNMWGKVQDIPTDIYYISPTNWDADKDGIYGEWKDDREAITYPDGSVGIGRIPVRSSDDIEAYTNKVTQYLISIDKTRPVGELTLTCAVPGAYKKVFRSGKEFIPKAAANQTVNFFFNDYSAWDEEKGNGSFELSPKNLVAKMNEGKTNKWHLHGHGLINLWVLENHANFTAAEVAKLNNIEHLPIITTVSCFTGQFDDTQDPCISESMLRHPTGGAIAIVAPARTGKPHFHDPEKDFPLMMKEGKLDGTTQTMTSFWVAGLGSNKTTGLALMTAKAGLAKDAKKSATYHQCLCELNLLGDPTLAIR